MICRNRNKIVILFSFHVRDWIGLVYTLDSLILKRLPKYDYATTWSNYLVCDGVNTADAIHAAEKNVQTQNLKNQTSSQFITNVIVRRFKKFILGLTYSMFIVHTFTGTMKMSNSL